MINALCRTFYYIPYLFSRRHFLDFSRLSPSSAVHLSRPARCLSVVCSPVEPPSCICFALYQKSPPLIWHALLSYLLLLICHFASRATRFPHLQSMHVSLPFTLGPSRCTPYHPSSSPQYTYAPCGQCGSCNRPLPPPTRPPIKHCTLHTIAEPRAGAARQCRRLHSDGINPALRSSFALSPFLPSLSPGPRTIPVHNAALTTDYLYPSLYAHVYYPNSGLNVHFTVPLLPFTLSAAAAALRD